MTVGFESRLARPHAMTRGPPWLTSIGRYAVGIRRQIDGTDVRGGLDASHAWFPRESLSVTSEPTLDFPVCDAKRVDADDANGE